jgi:exopolysaccharide biosynthesis predicted pyruvyltransferase EpsI
MGVPTVVSDNSYGKVRGLYETYTSRAPTARWARSPEDALATAREWIRTAAASQRV